ncbi:variable large family protein (plasmid) [Borrelia coriaceae]|uniref:Variable large protein n=1 Tax=Borrelia coriaceae ATCC 43381 TaxID=1408429 RepID=W5SXN0_9SPIR|nr:variable large family protein [Borrelia coriaceae]AHH11443.1 Variable major outer membrane lipoprotein [Borrelia coriaceae ATCC 43381]UPA17403.1 variable large family protein [Borrelia coriaceae]
MKINIKSIRVRSICATLFISLFLSCNNSGEIEVASEAERQAAESLKLGDTAKSVFSSFVDLIANTLGISVTSSTKKSDVSDKFKNLASSIEKAIGQVQEAANKAGINIEDDKDGGVGQAKKTLDELKKHITSLQTLTNDGEVVSGVKADSASQVQGTGASIEDVQAAVKALKGIVDANTNKKIKPKTDTVSSGDTNGGKVLNTTGGGTAIEENAAKALAIVNSVRGEDILYAIALANETDVVAEATIANATAPEHAVKLAVTGAAKTTQTAERASKVAVAGGIALRSLLKGGKLDAASTAANINAVNGVGVTAVNKLLNAIENIVQVVVKQCLEQTAQILGDSKVKSPQEKNNIIKTR